MHSIRPPAVAGYFYPSDPDELLWEIYRYLDGAKARIVAPKAIIAPHAGYMYSAPVAAYAYACIRPARAEIRRVVLLGPAHRVYVRGIALSSADSFATPLGEIAIDKEAMEQIRDLPQCVVSDEAHALEHSLEVHLPFLQTILNHFYLIPLVVGDCPPIEVAEVLQRLWDGPETLIVVSSDLSHYHDYETAKQLDAATSAAIEACRLEDIDSQQACGCKPINGLLKFSREHGLHVTRLELKNSGDTAGPREQVVGYGAFAVH